MNKLFDFKYSCVVRRALKHEIAELEKTKAEFPDEEWMYEPDLTEAKEVFKKLFIDEK